MKKIMKLKLKNSYIIRGDIFRHKLKKIEHEKYIYVIYFYIKRYKYLVQKINDQMCLRIVSCAICLVRKLKVMFKFLIVLVLLVLLIISYVNANYSIETMI